MINIECSGCRYDLNSGESCYCEDCYNKLQEQIDDLEEIIDKLESEIDSYQREISRLEQE